MAKRTLPLSKIRLDGNTQPRVELDEFLINEYKEAYQNKAEMPPLEVKFDGASYWLWDGFHRRWGADRAGLEKLPCNVTNGTQQDAQWASYGANVTHGLRRSNPDKAKAVKAALRHPNGPKMSDSQIAEHVGVSMPTVSKYRAELETTSNILKSDSRTGRDGRTINTANIGKSKPTDHHPVADDSDDDQDADGGESRVTSGTLAGMEPDPVGVDSEPTTFDKYRARLIDWTRKQFENIDGLDWPMAKSVWISLGDSNEEW